MSRSGELYAQARELLPGGVNSPVRAMRSIGRDPIFIASGAGATITDVDGNDYIDWVGAWGPPDPRPRRPVRSSGRCYGGHESRTHVRGSDRK